MKKVILSLLFLAILALAACSTPAPAEPAAPAEVPADAPAPEDTTGLDTQDADVQEEELFDESEIADDIANW